MVDSNFVQQQYSLPEVLEQYDKITQQGLGESEKFLIERYFPARSRILDIGCGTGRMAHSLAMMGHDVEAVDFSEGMVSHAVENARIMNIPVNCHVGDATALGVRSSVFDAVTFAFNGLNCIPGLGNRTKALQEIHRVLKHGGIFLFSSHVRDDHDSLADYWTDQQWRLANGKTEFSGEELGDRLSLRFGRKQFINIPELDALQELLEGNGFNIEFHGNRDSICRDETLKIGYRTDLFVCKAEPLFRSMSVAQAR